jgi:hypothetical protein
MQIESYRTRMEAFERRLNGELYLHYSGHKKRLEIQSIYSDYSDLFSLESIREVENERSDTSEAFSSRRKSLEKIIGFLTDQRLELQVASWTQECARFEAEQTIFWEGEKIPVARAADYLKNESDANARRQLSDRYAQALSRSEAKPEKIRQLDSASAGLGFKNYLEAREKISGTQYRQVLDSLDSVWRRLENLYWDRFRGSLDVTLGASSQTAGCWDIGYWQKKNNPARVFSDGNFLAIVQKTVAELGIQPERPDAIQFDLEERALKKPRPFCIPIQIPREIRVVMPPGDGAGYCAAMLHETGHAHHFAWTSAALPVEHRIWGDRALSEAFAFLFEHCMLDRHWLAQSFSYAKCDEFLRFQALSRVFQICLWLGTLQFAVRFYEQEDRANSPRLYFEIMKARTGLQHHTELWMDGLRDGLDAADYFRGWILESMLREHLRLKFGTAWFLNRSAGGFLKEIWETGQLYRAEELCREIGIGDPEPQILADELREGLKS